MIAHSLVERKAEVVYSIAYEFLEGNPLFLCLHANARDLGMFPGKQYVLHVRIIRPVKENKKLIFTVLISSSYLFSVKRDGSSNIMYKICFFFFKYFNSNGTYYRSFYY
jgi:hypothetical protein